MKRIARPTLRRPTSAPAPMTQDFTTAQPLRLQCGQIGTVVTTYANDACEVEFAGRDGRAYAILPIHPEKLMVLHYRLRRLPRMRLVPAVSPGWRTQDSKKSSADSASTLGLREAAG